MKTHIAFLFVIAAIVIFTSSCRTNRGAGQTSIPVSSSTTYEGKLPCADCPGIIETITLVRTTEDEGTYTQKDVYLEREGSFEETGRWKTSKGIPSDPNATLLTLTPENNDPPKYYQMTDTALNPLDQDKKPIKSPFNQSLTKK